MKQNSTPKQWLATAVTGLALAFSAGTSWAAPDQILGTFDNDLTGYFVWGRGWGNHTVEWNANGNPGGCLVAHGLLESTNSDTPVCVYAVNAGNPWWHPSPTFDFTQYRAIEFDIKWNNDPANIPLNDFNYPTGDPASWADSGLLIGALGTNDANNIVLTNMPIPAAAAGAWVHVTIPIDRTKPGLGDTYGVWIRKWICNPPANPGDWQTGHVITNSGNYEFFVDNVVLIGDDPLPNPTMSPPVPATAGMNFIAASAQQYDRQEIRTVATNYSWIGASGPVTYSVDVAKLGDNSAPGTLFFHWVPGGADPNANDSDWHEPHVLMWSIGNNVDGTAWSSLRYKTNAPNDNGNMYGSGNLGGPGSATGKGTWSITFDGNTTATMTSPDGTTLTANLPPEVITIFQTRPGMQVNIGQVPNNGPTPAGQKSVITGARFTGTPSTIDSNFLPADVDTNIWRAFPNGPNGVKWVPSTSPFWLSWSLPANGFSLQSKAALGAGLWNDPTPWGFDVGGKHHVLLSAADIPSQNGGYFRLIKRAASRLLILLPGETNAPNTVTGKIGTPTVTNSAIFTVQVLSTDDTFHPVSVSGPEISLSCSGLTIDGSGNWVPTHTLVNGVASWTDEAILFTSGYTFTATTTNTWLP
jgi:hypothetical protein